MESEEVEIMRTKYIHVNLFFTVFKFWSRGPGRCLYSQETFPDYKTSVSIPACSRNSTEVL